MRLPRPPAEVNAILREQHGIIGGYDLGGDYPHLADHMLLAVTELNTRAAIDRLVDALREIAAMRRPHMPSSDKKTRAPSRAPLLPLPLAGEGRGGGKRRLC